MHRIILVFVLLAGIAKAQELDTAIKSANALSQVFANVAEQVTPALVNINSVKKINYNQNHMRRMPPGFNDPFQEFFRQFTPPGVDPYSQQGMGSGFIIDTRGYIVTNNHVIGDGDEIEVKLTDKRIFKAKIIGTDPKTDLAVIKVDANDLQPVKLGDSSNLKIGTWVVAAGNPFGLDNTITSGIISAKGRSISGGAQYEDYIQTDAAINPGNSGGPLLNLNAEVIGINTAIFTKSGGYMGIGFAIPINLVKPVIDSLISRGKVTRGWLGVAIQDLTDELAGSFNYQSKIGALVGDISPSSPAATAGFKTGDIIISFNGKKVNNSSELRNMVAETKPGKEVVVTVIRDSKEFELDVKIGTLDDDQATYTNKQTSSSETEQYLGLTLQDLSKEDQQYYNTIGKVLILEVEPYSTAFKSELQAGDIVLKVGNEDCKSAEQFKKLVKKTDLKKGIRLIVENQGMKRFVILKEE